MIRHTAIPRVLHRPNLILGGERDLVLVALMTTAGVAAVSANVIAACIALSPWFAIAPLLRKMAKADPQMSRLFIRYRRFRGYYPARSRPYRGAEMGAAAQWSIIAGGFLAVLIMLAVLV